MTSPAHSLYTTRQIRLCESEAINRLAISADELMERAGQAAFRCLKNNFPSARTLTVFCGGGNNAGDGYVLARLAQAGGYRVIIHQYRAIEQLPDTARHAALRTVAAGIICQDLDEPIDEETDVIIDALLGIGLQGEVQGPLALAITQINSSGCPVLALDIPSGLNSDTGEAMGVCVRASATVTFIGKKIGQMTLDGPDHCGALFVDTLQLETCLSSLVPEVEILDGQQLRSLLTPRPRNSHKGLFGHVLIIGGGPGMPGAVCLAASAALRAGAGLVTVATRPEHAVMIPAAFPEVMAAGIDDVHELLPLLAKATVCVIGPGLGMDEWAVHLFNLVIASQLPMVIDASALHLLAQNPQHDDNWILTPHPGEAAALLGLSTADIQCDRCEAVSQIQQRYGGNVVLKGAGSLIKTDKMETYLCAAGNPGMSSPGMGDVLSGILAALVAQGLSLSNALKLGVQLHAQAADRAALKLGERGLLASDLLPYLQRLANQKETDV